MSKINILGVEIDDVSLDQAVNVVTEWLNDKKKYYIVTPNPEFIIAAQKDNVFRNILNDADLSIPDGIGLRLSGRIKNRVAGVDLMERLIEKASQNGSKLGFLGGQKGVADRCAERLRQRYPQLNISFVSDGGFVDQKGDSERYKIPPTDILFVAFGHGKQERWIYKNLNIYPVRIMMGVGGSLDYLSGAMLRAPKLLRSVGLEWLFRLVLQPWRIKRQLKLVNFIYLLLFKDK